MKTVTIAEFKRNPSKYLRFTAAGLKVLILGRKKPIAMLEPTKPEDDEESLVKELAKRGIVKPHSNRKTGSKLGAKLAL